MAAAREVPKRSVTGEHAPAPRRAAILPSQRSDWGTPPAFFAAIDEVFHFTLDAAASEENAKCKRFFSESDDGLARSWSGEVVWLNPPFGDGLERWIQKAIDEAHFGATTVMLLPHRSGSRWWRLARQGEITELEGRIRFEGAANGAPFDCALVVFRPRLPARMQVPR